MSKLSNDDKLLKELLAIRSHIPEVVLNALIKKLERRNFNDIEVEKVTKKNYPLVYAVGRGSKTDSFVIKINHKAMDHSSVHIVGKGVVYDSGGYYMKPYPHMNDMYNDKMGAMLAVVSAIKHNVPATIFLVSNMVSDTSMVNGEILKSRNGTKVLVSHTDAEGRLGLADVVSMVDEIDPGVDIVTLATLTGAAHTFVGSAQLALLHSKDQHLVSAVVKEYMADGPTHDNLRLWPAPTHEMYERHVQSKVNGAHVTNAGNGKGAGSQDGYAFINRFTIKSELHHVDIAGMSDLEKGVYQPKGIKEVSFILRNLMESIDF